ncbi:uncharacterized protein LTR77_004359 [Saxophila tyrrhenica]|uniref:Uncharacterized protein n=1 Tax=Saxophila tyrrhenica TaxID=1690608 RepID=A0AAV9PGU6_9PEZI|nr:hypothetical protein LTR77_004359 [Saxophila tyrrhenica]
MPLENWSSRLGDGYPRYENDRYMRTPYEEHTLRDLDRANDPYASPPRRTRDDSPEDRRRFREEQRDLRPPPPPVLAVTLPTEEQRRSNTPDQRRGPYAGYRRGSETPPPGPRASRYRVPGYEEVARDVPLPRPNSRERLRYEPPGPSADPFNPNYGVADRPYGGGPPPRNPYGPGGRIYDRSRDNSPPRRSRSRDRNDVVDPEPNRAHHYQARVGEEWGLGEREAHRVRRRHEDRMRREHSCRRRR